MYIFSTLFSHVHPQQIHIPLYMTYKKLIRWWDTQMWHCCILLPVLHLTPPMEAFPWDDLRYKMAKKYCWKFQPPEYGKRTLQTAVGFAIISYNNHCVLLIVQYTWHKAKNRIENRVTHVQTESKLYFLKQSALLRPFQVKSNHRHILCL